MAPRQGEAEGVPCLSLELLCSHLLFDYHLNQIILKTDKEMRGFKGLSHAVCYLFKRLKLVFASIEFQKQWNSFLNEDYMYI